MDAPFSESGFTGNGGLHVKHLFILVAFDFPL